MGGKLPAQTYFDIDKKKKDFELLRRKLKLKHIHSKAKLLERHPHVDKILKEKGLDFGRVREHSAKVLGAGALAGTILLSPPDTTKIIPPPQLAIERTKESKNVEATVTSQKVLIDSLKELLPAKVRPLNRDEEKHLEQLFESIVAVKSKATLEGEHLNTTYGLIGAEQHLRRYPGDSLNNHGTGTALKEGIAPGLGAWGYFAPSKASLTPDLEETEKWYAVVQTLYLPEWGTRQPYLRDWYKYRKVLIVNTENGNAVVAAIGDSGPAAWTGKHFGGSPEVMDYLGGPRYKKGPVIIFFVDDPENKVQLGPVDYNNLANSARINLEKI